MKEALSMLEKSRLFREIPREVLRSCILPGGRLVSYPENAVIYDLQDPVDQIRILLSGRVKLVYYSERGDQDLRNILLPPSALGLELVYTQTRRSPCQAVAVAASRVFAFPSELLLEPGRLPEEARQRCIRNLLMTLSHINLQKEYRLAILTQRSLRERILTYLHMQASRQQTNTFTIPFSREELAAFLSVNRSALSHELSLLRQEGVLDFHRSRFTLLR